MKKLLYLLVLLACGLRLQAQTTTINQITPACDSNGVLVGIVIGAATPPLLFQWSTPEGYISDSVNSLTDTLHGFIGGYVSLSVYQYSTGTYDSVATATFNPVINIAVNSDTAICPALGVLTATVTGGSAPYTYQWHSNMSPAVASTTNPAYFLPANYYYVTVHDNAGCVASNGEFGHGNIAVVILPDFTDSTSIITHACPAKDTEIFHHMGGLPPFTVQWFSGYYGGPGATLIGTGDTLSFIPTATLGSFYEDYGILTDGNGCTAVASFDLAPTADFSDSGYTTPASCTNGTAGVVIWGGVPPFSYSWSTGATTATISGLVAGTYTATIMDSVGCMAALWVYVNQGITITDSFVVTNATCTDSNGVIMAFGSGGTPPYSYAWSTGATTQSIGGLLPNSYFCTVTDANSCTGYNSVYLSSTTPIMVSYTATQSSCVSATGTASLTITGGTPPYTITWPTTTPTRSGVYVTGLAVGTYDFYVTDATGCSQTGTVTVLPIDLMWLSFTAAPAHCTLANGEVDVTPTGGVAPYTYAWTGGSSTTNTLSGVTSGLYYVTVTDANHCEVTSCHYVPDYSPIVLGLTTTDASCLYAANGTILANATMGTPPYHYSMGGTSTGSVLVTGLTQGDYWVYVTDSAGCTTEEYTNVGYNVYDSSCFCVLKGNVYYDSLATCVRTTSDPVIDNIQINCSPFGYTYTDIGGNYYFLLPTGSYTVSENVLGFYPLSPCQVNHIPITATASSGCVIVQNFADTVNPIHDMSVRTWDYTFAIPGNTYTQATLITNNGTNTETNILASYTPDGQLYAPTFVPSGIFTGASYHYNTAASPYTLSPGASTLFLNSYAVPTSIPLGTSVVFNDSIAYEAPMSNWLTDYSPWNNIERFTTVTVASHDPNYKEVSPVGNGPLGNITRADSELTYMIHFQNTGTYMAQNVVVRDTLDANLDWTTMRPVFMQHEGKVDMDNYGRVTITFPNINLPTSSSDAVNSNAMLSYTIKTKIGMPIGTTFRNRASIYFDYNAPILTNQTLNTLWFPTSVTNVNNDMQNATFTIFPNPAENVCFADINSETAGSAEIRIIDITGKTVQHKTITLEKGNQRLPIDAISFNPGMYFVTIYGMGMTQTQKLVIMK